MKYHSDVLILGAGAAGLMCAIEAGKRGRSVTVLESSNRAGQKILISGGGRCNFTNLGSAPENFISGNPHFAKSALARYTPENFVAMVERHCIAWHEKKLGQLFCDRSAQDILTMLEEECVRVGVRVKLSAKVKEVRHAGQFTAITGEHEFASDALVVATGGLSIPKMGATAFGYELARQFGLKVVEPRPALVAFTLNPADTKRFCDLTGLSTEVVAAARQFCKSLRTGSRERKSCWIWRRIGRYLRIYWIQELGVTKWLPARLFVRCCQFAWQSAGSSCTHSRNGRIQRLKRLNGCCITLNLCPQAPRDLQKPRSRPEAWTRTSFRQRPWKP
jgi:hypothetical protein